MQKFERVKIQIKPKKELEALGIKLPFQIRGVEIYEENKATSKHLEIYGSEKFDIFSFHLQGFPKGSFTILDGDKVIINNKDEHIAELTNALAESQKEKNDITKISQDRFEQIARLQVQNNELNASLVACQNELKLAKEPQQELIVEAKKEKINKQ
jgi:hypothetical protein